VRSALLRASLRRVEIAAGQSFLPYQDKREATQQLAIGKNRQITSWQNGKNQQLAISKWQLAKPKTNKLKFAIQLVRICLCTMDRIESASAMPSEAEIAGGCSKPDNQSYASEIDK